MNIAQLAESRSEYRVFVLKVTTYRVWTNGERCLLPLEMIIKVFNQWAKMFGEKRQTNMVFPHYQLHIVMERLFVTLINLLHFGVLKKILILIDLAYMHMPGGLKQGKLVWADVLSKMAFLFVASKTKNKRSRIGLGDSLAAKRAVKAEGRNFREQKMLGIYQA